MKLLAIVFAVLISSTTAYGAGTCERAQQQLYEKYQRVVSNLQRGKDRNRIDGRTLVFIRQQSDSVYYIAQEDIRHAAYDRQDSMCPIIANNAWNQIKNRLNNIGISVQ